MNGPLVAALAVAGLVIGWFLRGVIFAYAVPSGAAPARACPHCGDQILAAGRTGSRLAGEAARTGTRRAGAAVRPPGSGPRSAGRPGPARRRTGRRRRR